MDTLISYFVLLPLLGFVISFLLPGNKEKIIATNVLATFGIQLTALIGFTCMWILKGAVPMLTNQLILFKSPHFTFFLDLYFDKITAVFMLIGSFLSLLVASYSRVYLHREEGYKRYFTTILFFYLGYSLVVLSGNLETLFVGWEILGITSFLLIAFYRDRYLPIKNGMKVFSIYRIGDVGLILTIWLNHHLWHQSITFDMLSRASLMHTQFQQHTYLGSIIALMLLIAAAAKSAQLPFSSWLPRAMEGPTPSSAIFYGSLSVHFGVFLLLRTYPFWSEQILIRFLIGGLGLTTAIVASSIAWVQSTVKSQIAYASIAQIGLMFIEVAIGLESVVLIHFAGNAFLRTYQLLVSPSQVSYLIREQSYEPIPESKSFEQGFAKRIFHTLYVLGLKEWNLDALMYHLIWKPFKVVGRQLQIFKSKTVLIGFTIWFALMVWVLFHEYVVPLHLQSVLPYLCGGISLLMVFSSYAEKESALYGWLLLLKSHFWLGLAVAFNIHFDLTQVYIYLSGIIVTGLLGILVLRKLQQLEGPLNLNRFYGHAFEHKKLALVFLVACLGMAGFPITPTFIGEDLLFSHIGEQQVLLAFILATSFVLSGISLMRIYGKLFYGPHIKTYHGTALKAS
jgi:NADH-quinone oxidoreductase subunit L